MSDHNLSVSWLPLSKAPETLLANIRLLVTDIDGTMTKNAKIPPEIFTALLQLKKNDVTVLPITGRPAGEALGLARYLPTITQIIAENGAVYLIPDQKVQYLQKRPDKSRFIEFCKKIEKNFTPLTLAPDSFCRLGDVAYLREDRQEQELQELQGLAKKEGIYLVWSSVHIHLSNHFPDKGKAALQISLQLGYTPEEIATIGDAPNDEGLWVQNRFALMVGTQDVVKQKPILQHTPSYLVKKEANGWLELAETIIKAKSGTV